MHSFEAYLLKNGWKIVEQAGWGTVYSSMGVLQQLYEHAETGRRVIFGLGEHGYPPHIISPVMYHTQEVVHKNGTTSGRTEQLRAPQILELMAKHTPEEMLTLLYAKEPTVSRTHIADGELPPWLQPVTYPKRKAA